MHAHLTNVRLEMKFLFLLFFASSAFAQNLIPINPSAGTGDLDGWVAQSVSYGAVVSPDPLNSLSVTSNPIDVSDGANSFWLHDGSTSSSEQLSSSESNFIQINTSMDYQFSADIKIVGSPSYPLWQLIFWSSPTGGSNEEQEALNLLAGDDFSSTTFLANGFIRYTFDDNFAQDLPGGPAQLYCQLEFFTDYYATSQSNMYVDNISVQALPEPGVNTLLCFGLAGLIVAAHRNRMKFGLHPS